MKNFKISLIAITLIISSFVRADEGMWLPFLLGRNYEDMKKHGLNLTQEEIYSINNSSLKDAIISFGGFCTGEIISKKGLILTNHHCGYDAIAEASSKENNYLDDGFWAKSIDQEIPVAGLTASFIIRIADVSETINKELNENMTIEERNAKIKELSAILTKDATEGTHYEAFIRDFFEGNEFYLFVKETFNDIRMVGTPPQSAGKFGGDTDNWMWPRHTADFSMFRIYADANNQPAQFSADNKPYSPKHSLPISIKGVQENDYAMILGFPGSTERFMSSYGIDQTVNYEYPKRVDIRGKKLTIMKSYMDNDVDTRLAYSSKYAQVANYWKNFQGMTEQVKNNKVIKKKEMLESDFIDFAANKAQYKDVIPMIKRSYEPLKEYVYIKAYQSEMIYSVDLFLTPFRYTFWGKAMLASGQEDRAKMIAERFKPISQSAISNSNIDLELETIHELMKMYIKDIPTNQQGEYTKALAGKGDKGLSKLMSAIRKKSIFVDSTRFANWAANPNLKTLNADPLYKLVKDLGSAYENVQSNPVIIKSNDDLENANRLFVKGLREMQPEKQFYPNANSTLRLTYGNILPYDPKDGVSYHYTTSIDGIMEKEDPNNTEFHVHPRIKEVWSKKDFGQYADKTGNLTVNFLSNNDITGGNSGSPVINADGQLIGTAFDGNWEAMSGDIFFEPNIQRTISLDVRYTLWLVDKCFGATNLIEEMELVK